MDDKGGSETRNKHEQEIGKGTRVKKKRKRRGATEDEGIKGE
jgi:hypothetical protein